MARSRSKLPQRLYRIKIHDLEGVLQFQNLFYMDNDEEAALASEKFAAWYSEQEGYAVNVKVLFDSRFSDMDSIPEEIHDEYAELYDMYQDLSIEFSFVWSMI